MEGLARSWNRSEWVFPTAARHCKLAGRVNTLGIAARNVRDSRLEDAQGTYANFARVAARSDGSFLTRPESLERILCCLNAS
jgi:hypothetical protein